MRRLVEALALMVFVLAVLPGCHANRPPYIPEPGSDTSAGVVDSLYVFWCEYPGDPENDDVAIRFDWDDGDTSDWGYIPGPPWPPETCVPPAPVTMTHSWSMPDTYFVRAQARDTHDSLSGWSNGYLFAVRQADPSRDPAKATALSPSYLGSKPIADEVPRR